MYIHEIIRCERDRKREVEKREIERGRKKGRVSEGEKSE